MRSSDSASAVEHSTALRKVAVSAPMSSRKQAPNADAALVSSLIGRQCQPNPFLKCLCVTPGGGKTSRVRTYSGALLCETSQKDAKAGDGVNSGILGALPVAKRPEVNEQVAAPAVAKSSSTTTTTSTMRPAQALGDGAVIPQGAAPPLKDNLHVQFKSPQNPIQLEVAKQPAEMPVEQPGQQIAQPAVPQLPKPALPSVEAALQKSVAPKAPKAPGVGQADKDLSDQEQPPLQAPENGDGQDEAIAAPKKQEAAAGNADNNKEMQVRPPVAKAAHGEAGDHQVAAGGDSVPVLGAAPDVEVPPKPVNGEAAQAKKGNAPARGHEENLLWGGHRNGAAWQGGRQAEEDNQEYVNPAKDDDAAEDQEDDGPFGAAGDAAQGKHFPDAADFDDQAAEGDVQQPNHGREEGMMVNPK
ncbi:hypothetical protein HPB47_003145 [Ixodes persulcatus]|uniref:Uncharacterized protein n=1 Tax=Ixodes persulcatus TaxID=34615 RepID=A0AC60PJA2_IXOPE|nr:hypothetical protein HPB47_003145 [Ixodes persulcatus]